MMGDSRCRGERRSRGGWSRACQRDKLDALKESDLSSFRDWLMTSSRQLSRTPWIALAAVTGTLLATDEAWACLATEARTAPPSCCTGRRAAGCVCCRIAAQREPAGTTVSVVRSELSSRLNRHHVRPNARRAMIVLNKVTPRHCLRRSSASFPHPLSVLPICP